MTLTAPKNKEELKQEIVKMVNEYMLSSIMEMSDRLGIDHDTTVEIINDLLNSGELKGRLDLDNGRFFNNRISVSGAPAVEDAPGAKVVQPDLTITKNAIIIGLIALAIAYLFPNVSIGHLNAMDIRGIFLLLAIGFIIGGLIYASRFETKIVVERN